MEYNHFLSSYKFQSHPSAFASDVRERVRSYFAKNKIKRQGGVSHILKALTMILIYVGSYFLIITEVETNGILFWVWILLFTIGFLGIGMTITHDASHGALSSNKSINLLFYHFFDLVGPSSTIWKIQHVILHHQYTNIEGIDEDINPSDMLRFTPEVQRRSWHKYQHIYAWLFYCLNTLYWITLKDVECFFRYYKRGYFKAFKMNVFYEAIKFLFFKTFYFTYILIIPIYFTDIGTFKVISGWLLMQAIGGLTLALIIQPGHVLSALSYSKSRPDLDQKDPVIDRLDYQVTTTANFGNNSKFLTWFSGGLNHQIEHHLFPEISHIHYNKISYIVMKTTEDHNLPYFTNKTWWSGIVEHYKMLKLLGTKD